MPRSLLVAFSGGLDSVVLLDALHRWCEKMPYVATLSAAHVHHGLSPNADAWLAFCERFCAERGIAFTARRLTLPQKPQTSLEETARLARHAALREIAGEMGADAIALAHHQDDQVETLLALGATRWEASRTAIQQAVRTGMIPTINTMMIVGLVSLPGMMTGQLLAGMDPLDAVKYQIVIMFLIAAGTSLGTFSIVLLGYRRLFTLDHQFLPERLVKRL